MPKTIKIFNRLYRLIKIGKRYSVYKFPPSGVAGLCGEIGILSKKQINHLLAYY
jgi:hypothetical protein